LISGNTLSGVFLLFCKPGNLVEGNYVGTDVTGAASIANGFSGVEVQSPGQIVGGTAAGAGNLISGNGGDGVLLERTAASASLVQGNLIGLSASGAGP